MTLRTNVFLRFPLFHKTTIFSKIKTKEIITTKQNNIFHEITFFKYALLSQNYTIQYFAFIIGEIKIFVWKRCAELLSLNCFIDV